MDDQSELKKQRLNTYYRLVRMVGFGFLDYFMLSARSSFPAEGLLGILWNGLPIFFIATYCSEVRREEISVEWKFGLILTPLVAEIFTVMLIGHLHMTLW